MRCWVALPAAAAGARGAAHLTRVFNRAMREPVLFPPSSLSPHSVRAYAAAGRRADGARGFL